MNNGPRGSDAKEHSSRGTKIYSSREYSLLLNSSYFLIYLLVIYLFLQLVVSISISSRLLIYTTLAFFFLKISTILNIAIILLLCLIL